MCLSLAATSIGAECPSGKAPTTRVLLRISRIIRSRGLSSSIAFYDRRLERQVPQLRYFQLDLTGFRFQLPGVIASTCVLSLR